MASTIMPRDGCGQCCHKVGVASACLHTSVDGRHENIHASTGSEHTDGYEYGHEIRYDTHSCGESFFCSFDEGFIDIDFLDSPSYDEGQDDGKEDDVCYHGADCVHGLFIHLAEGPDDRSD